MYQMHIRIMCNAHVTQAQGVRHVDTQSCAPDPLRYTSCYYTLKHPNRVIWKQSLMTPGVVAKQLATKLNRRCYCPVQLDELNNDGIV